MGYWCRNIWWALMWIRSRWNERFFEQIDRLFAQPFFFFNPGIFSFTLASFLSLAIIIASSLPASSATLSPNSLSLSLSLFLTWRCSSSCYGYDLFSFSFCNFHFFFLLLFLTSKHQNPTELNWNWLQSSWFGIPSLSVSVSAKYGKTDILGLVQRLPSTPTANWLHPLMFEL